MAKNSNLTLDPSKLGINSLADSLLSGGNWDDWNDSSGDSVLKFIKELLATSVLDINYDSTGHVLSGLNAFGDVVCSTEIVNMDPVYDMLFAFNSLYINGSQHTNGEQVPYSDLLKVEAGITLKMWFTVLNQTAVKAELKVYFYVRSNPSAFIEVPVIPQDLDATDEIIVPITELLGKVNSKDLASAVFCARVIPSMSSINEQTVEYLNTVNIIKLDISSTSDLIVYGKVDYLISGIPEGGSDYSLVYYAVPIETALSINTSSSSYSPLLNSVPITLGSTNCSITLEDTPGVYLIYARLQNNSRDITSTWLQTNVINITSDYSGQALIGVNNIAALFVNCDTSKLYEVSVVSGVGGSVSIKSYISNTTSGIISDTNLYKTNDYLDLSSLDGNYNVNVWSYNELTNVADNTSRYIGIQLVILGVSYILKRFYISNNGALRAYDYYPISIIENEGNINGAFTNTPNSILDFSQITSTNNNVFESSNIDPSLISGDGYLQDDKRLIYKVSPQYTDTNQGLFKTPVDLKSLLNSNFTLDIIYNSTNASDSSANFSIGDLKFGPGFMYLNGDETTQKDSLVSFQKEEYTHLIITYTKGYKPNTYPNTYTDFFPEYASLDSCVYNVLKVYVNGCINREIELTGTEELGNFLFQIHPITSTLKLAQFRTYDFALSYELILKNTISGLMDSISKTNYYNRNNILKADGTISLYKAMKDNNVLIHILPHGTTPVWFGQQEVKGSSLLIHYKDPSYKNYNGRFVGKEENKMTYKNQGTSANKYLFHNTAILKFAFQNEEAIASGTADRSQTYYLMPNDLKTQITKIVGKVNYASSMQSHKPGSCATFHETYSQILNSEDSIYADFKKEPKLYTGGRKAVNELSFLYFYYVLDENDTRSPEEIQLSDLYTISKDALGNDIVTEKDVKFFGFLTWGSAKGDPATSGYNKNTTPEYLLMEGADNGSLGANFKMPWAALQSKGNTTTSITKEDRITGLVIKKKTIEYESDTDPWDIDFGCDDTETEFTEGVKESVKIFADFCDAMYLYDFLNLRGIKESDIANLTANDADYKYYITDSGTTYHQFDLIRYDLKDGKWVPGGLTRKGTVWETFNLKTYLNSFGQSTDPIVKYVIEHKPTTTQGFTIDFNIPSNETDVSVVIYEHVIPYFRALFKRTVEVYLDIEDVAFHLAFIKVINGTDNRAKNTYYQIIGKVYEKDEETGNYIKTDIGDYKIRLVVDDLDTIFATNNNGQLVIPSYLLEPVFNSTYDGLWNDRNNALFYAFDLLYEDKIYKYVLFIIDYLVRNEVAISSQATNLYKNYFSVQNGFPEIAYNHHAELYYEVANLVFNENLRPNISSGTKGVLTGFENNGVPRPLSLSHGRCVEGEYQFLEERLSMLGSLCDVPKAVNLYKGNLPLSSDSGGDGTNYSIEADVTSNTYIAPIKVSTSNEYNRVVSYTLKDIFQSRIIENNKESVESILSNLYDENTSPIRSICNLMTPTTPEVTMKVTGISNIAASLKPTSAFKSVTFKSGLKHVKAFLNFPRASVLEIDGNQTLYTCTSNGTIKVSAYLELIETLKMTNVIFAGTSVVLDFRGCNKLTYLDLTGCTGIKGIILPSNKYLIYLALPQNVEILQMGYCLSLNYSNIVIPNSNFTSITIDGRNSFVSQFIETFGRGFRGQLTINSTKILFLSYNALSVLSDLSNLTFIDVEQINVSEMHFLVKFKLHRHNSFSGITITGYPTISYYEVSFSPDPYIISLGTSNNYLGCLDFITSNGESANDIDISKLTFSIGAVTGVTLDPNTLEINVAPTVTDNTEISLTIKYKGTTVASPVLKVGFNVPQLGDFAYADGSFSKKYNASKAIGYVYKCEEVTKGIYQVSIMSLEPIETSKLGYSEPRNYVDGNESELYKIINNYDVALNSGVKIIDRFPKISRSPLTNCEDISSNTTDNDIKYQGEGTIEEYEDDIMKEHIDSALLNYISMHNYIKNFYAPVIINDPSDITNNETYEAKQKVNKLLELLDGSYMYEFADKNYTTNITPILFPAYLRTYAYTPSNCDTASSHKVVKKYVNQSWKIPSTHTIAYLVRDIMRSLVSNTTDPAYWSSTENFSTTSKSNNIFSNMAKNNSKSNLGEWLTFLGTDPKMTCEFGKQDAIYVNYTYHEYSDQTRVYRTFTIDTSRYYAYYNPIGLRSNLYSYVYPCITISLSKEDYVNN